MFPVKSISTTLYTPTTASPSLDISFVFDHRSTQCSLTQGSLRQIVQIPQDCISPVPQLSQAVGFGLQTICPNLAYQETELLHHFFTFALFTFVPRGDIDYHIIQLILPTLQSSEFVLRAVLGISALHLASLYSETNCSRYQNLALEHLYQGTSSFRTTVDRLDPQNIDAIFTFSGMSILFEIALMHPAYKIYLREQSPIDQLLQVFILWRKIVTLRQSFPQSFRQAILPKQVIVQGMTDAHRSKMMESKLAQMQHFGLLSSELDSITQRLHSLNRATTTDSAEVQIYAEAIDLLHLTFSNFIKSPGHWSLALLWPSGMSMSCVEHMRERRPFALLLLGYYCALLHHGTNQWWMREWDRSVLSAISQTLDGQWIKHISWAVQAVQDAVGCHGCVTDRESRDTSG
ncbi:hypothetical protein OIDMADRAFT_48727 [Oidiodendron maius Zn]|uniref:Transcription factor domain-containing protein n=1 Tax=Oidiodendron maius (strain Zn) TaxID=913774 RepID=A0A0C3DC04_OIDMZ|nr:hypothetical protein OIDMADRAFT_48727 [Oidiodendron maius Zn]